MEINEIDNLVMKILHYFITEKNYQPVVIQGLKDEIWLENMKEDYKIVRIVSKHIHNTEQLDYDHYRAKRIGKSIKKQTFLFSLNMLNIYTDLGDNAVINDTKNMTSITVDEDDLDNGFDKVLNIFPNIKEMIINNENKESSLQTFLRLTGDIESKSVKNAKIFNEIFRKKTPYITYFLIILNVVIFFLGNISGKYEYIIDLFCLYGPLVRIGEYYRIITSMFLHGNLIHLFLNMYALYVIGQEVESYFGKFKFIIIYMLSGIFGSLVSITFGDYASVGASGAIFGLMGSLLYFGYHYRSYLGQSLINQITPIIIINLIYGFMATGIDNFAHIGGLIGGILTTSAVGVKLKESKSEQFNGIVITLILLVFLIYMGIFKAR